MAELKRQLEVLEDEIWEMEMGQIRGENVAKYQNLLMKRVALRKAIREAE